MPIRNVPDYIVDKTRVKQRNGALVVGGTSAAAAYIALQVGSHQGFLISSAICAVSFFVAYKIKTRKYYRGSGDIFE
ncbi:MAG: hypothetical protein HLUCCO06_17330 [Halomonas sp. HL-93]|nr:MAG: hypothetical protein HLUCCO06_17330 [Halomonas sp. HL-93]